MIDRISWIILICCLFLMCTLPSAFKGRLVKWCYSYAFDWFSCLNLQRTMSAITSIHSTLPLKALGYKLSETTMVSDKNVFQCWKFKNLFIQKSEKGANITVQWKICLPTTKMLPTLKVSNVDSEHLLWWMWTEPEVDKSLY